MRWRLSTASLVMLLAGSSSTLLAQWPQYRSPGVPRTVRGETDLAAPVPRTPDAKPDLSGLWENTGWNDLRAANPTVSGTGGSPGTPRVLPTGPALFFDISSGVENGLPLQPW